MKRGGRGRGGLGPPTPYQVTTTVKEVVVRPGEPLPVGEFVKAWKLDGYGKGAICIHFVPPK